VAGELAVDIACGGYVGVTFDKADLRLLTEPWFGPKWAIVRARLNGHALSAYKRLGDPKMNILKIKERADTRNQQHTWEIQREKAKDPQCDMSLSTDYIT